MAKIFCKLFNILKFIMLVLCFSITLYILTFMYRDLGKNIFGESFFEFFGNLFPFILLIVLFAVNICWKHHFVNDNIFYNSSCVVAFLAIFFIGIRALYDSNMIFLMKNNFNINFNYFSDQITQIKVLVYLMCCTNILFIINNKLFHKKEIII